MAAAAAECGVCALSFTKTRRSAVDCARCDFRACQACTRKYLLTATALDPKCMSCGGRWTDEFIDAHLPRSFRTGELAAHRAKVAFDLENAKLADTVEDARRYKAKRAVLDRAAEVGERIKRIRARLDDAVQLRADLKATADAIGRDARAGDARAAEKMCCPGAGCRGFIALPVDDADGGAECGLCGARVCCRCRCLVMAPEQQHVCRTEDLQTVAALAKDTKPCPRCAVPIFKVDGCDQMWCVSCRTAFGWRTGRVVGEDERIHNPEYFRWLRETGQDDPQNAQQQQAPPCGRDDLPDYHRLRVHVHARLPSAEKLAVKMLESARRAAAEVEYIDGRLMPRSAILGIELGDPYADLRVRFLAGEIDRDAWQKELIRRMAARDRLRASRELCDTLAVAGAAVLANAMNIDREGDELEAWRREAEALRLLFNEAAERRRGSAGSAAPLVWND